MRNALKIFSSTVFLAGLILSASVFLVGCKQKTEKVEDTVKDIDDFLDDTTEELSDLTDMTDLTADDDEFEEEQSYEELDEAQEEMEDLTDLTAPVTTKSEPVSKPQPVSRPKVTSSVSGKYLLVAGNYSVRENAESMRSKLKRMGYNAAEIVNFDNSSFSTVLASRYQDYEAAVRASGELKNRGIDCYVHTRKD